MKSYAAVDRIENRYAICEVEQVDVHQSHHYPIAAIHTVMSEVPYETIFLSIGEVQEGDIIVVEHNNGDINHVYYKDDDAKRRRIEHLKEIRKNKKS